MNNQCETRSGLNAAGSLSFVDMHLANRLLQLRFDAFIEYLTGGEANSPARRAE